MFSSNNKKIVSRLIELLNQNETKAQYYVLNDYDKNELSEFAIEVYKLFKNAEAENQKLKTELNEQLQGNQIKVLEQKCLDANNRYLTIFKQQEDSFKKNQEMEQQRKALEKITNDYIETLKKQKDEMSQKLLQCQSIVFQVQAEQNLQFPQNKQYQREFDDLQKSFKDVSNQCGVTIKEIEIVIDKAKEDQKNEEIQKDNLQSFQDILVKYAQAKKIINELIQKETLFRNTKNITDNDINNIFDNHLRILQMNLLIMNQFETILVQMYKDITTLEKKTKILKQENNKLNEQIKNIVKTNQEQINMQKPIKSSIEQDKNLLKINPNKKNQLFINFNKLQEKLIFSNNEFYKILLQFVSQGLTISDLQLKLSNQNQMVEIVNQLQQFVQLQIPDNFQKISENAEKFKQYFNGLKQYITDKNNLIDVLDIQDKFFQSYGLVINQFLEIEKIQKSIDQEINIK